MNVLDTIFSCLTIRTVQLSSYEQSRVTVSESHDHFLQVELYPFPGHNSKSILDKFEQMSLLNIIIDWTIKLEGCWYLSKPLVFVAPILLT